MVSRDLYPFNERGGTIHLTELAAERLSAKHETSEYHQNPFRDGYMLAHKLRLLPEGWVHAVGTVETQHAGVYHVDVLLAPGEVIAVENSYPVNSKPDGRVSYEGVGSSRSDVRGPSREEREARHSAQFATGADGA